MNQDNGLAINSDEDNILKAFEQGAHDIINQKRDPKDFIVFGAPDQNDQKDFSNQEVSQQKNKQTQQNIVIGFEEDDDDFTGNQAHYNHNIKNTQNQQNNYSSNINDAQNNIEEDDFDDGNKDQFKIDVNNQMDNQMFINRNELEAADQNTNGQVVSRPAGIYLEKDDDLEKLKELYEGQEKQKVEATNKQFSLNRQAQEKKKKQFQDQKKQKEDKDNQNVAKLTNNDFKFDKSNKIKNIINDEEELGEIGEWIEKTANVNKKKKDDGFDDDDDEDDAQKSNNDDEDFNFDDIVDNNKNNTKQKGQQPNQEKINLNNIIAEDEEDEQNWENQEQGNNQNVNNIISQEVQQQKKKEEQEMLKQKQDLINKKLQQQQILKHKSGPIANRLQDKAKFMELTNNNKEQENVQVLKQQTSDQQIKNGQSNNVIQIEEEVKQEIKNEEQDDGDEVDWDQINQQAMKQYQVQIKQNISQQDKLINFIDAWSDFKKQNLSEYKKQIVTSTQDKKSFSVFEFLNSFCGVINPNISSVELLNERDQIFALAKLQFDDEQPLHFQILYSIFCNLTNNYNCPRIGSHWEQIGFQGKNPGTDLRGAGMLGLLQILAFVSHYKDYIIDVLKYSHDPIHNFPLSITLINVTDIVLQACREQKLNSLINKEKSVISVFNNFYFATFYFLFSQYKAKQYTVNRFDELKKNIEVAVKHNPKKTLEDFKQAIQQYYKLRE
ncbi:ELMO/CED-12 family protein (macronuclear) [Tetrahymena thermophila SB210]|uniref:ELMO/CED-12 family protein n=1 Tax=Tetrahymena thermophila (strain SB210) TaxID=312017 RepID=I7M023_TETTS|nr:ELMO/CED-12 family protein [Tetrahymena thermophila SB210]EAR85347.1 ELMO/CED-12 family protein [Tetrahymena thermophila SB210]|eukprot:XP_001033010.1 ELMO/CED-12 family protein [Tetrahymena thermophila SB210]